MKALSVAIGAAFLVGGCASAGVPFAIGRERPNGSTDGSTVSTARRATTDSVQSSAAIAHERPFEPKGGVVILGPNGKLIVMQLWEGDARPESACPSGLPAMSPATFRDVATLHVMPSPGASAPSKANGYRFGEDTFAAFSGRLFEQNLHVTGVKLPAKLEGGTTITVPVDVSDVGGSSVYGGRVKVFVCDLSK